MIRYAGLLLIVMVTAPVSTRAETSPVVVSAAVSLSNVLQDLAAAWQAKTGQVVTLNLGASNTLARQIVAGAQVDLFISADEAQLAVIERAGLVVRGTRVDLLGNQLAIAVPADRSVPIASPRALLDPAVRRIAIGDPAGVPAGVYAREYLRRQRLWEALEPKIVPTGSVRLALTAVENGAADAAIVYRSDLSAARDARAAYVVPLADAPRIVYPAALVTTGGARAAAARFLAYLQGPEAAGPFERAGFVALTTGASGR